MSKTNGTWNLGKFADDELAEKNLTSVTGGLPGKRLPPTVTLSGGPISNPADAAIDAWNTLLKNYT